MRRGDDHILLSKQFQFDLPIAERITPSVSTSTKRISLLLALDRMPFIDRLLLARPASLTAGD